MSEEEFGEVVSWLNYYSHQTNLLRLVLGEDYTLRHAQESERGHFLTVETPSGVPAFMEFPRYVVKQWDEGFQVFFERAILRCDIPSPMARQRAAQVSLYENREGGGTFSPDIPPRWAMAEQAQAFVAAVRGGERLSPPREAAKEIAFTNELIRWRQARG
jgi:predicted dehydrogenase